MRDVWYSVTLEQLEPSIHSIQPYLQTNNHEPALLRLHEKKEKLQACGCGEASIIDSCNRAGRGHYQGGIGETSHELLYRQVYHQNL